MAHGRDEVLTVRMANGRDEGLTARMAHGRDDVRPDTSLCGAAGRNRSRYHW